MLNAIWPTLTNVMLGVNALWLVSIVQRRMRRRNKERDSQNDEH
jgi:hypothetical protein